MLPLPVIVGGTNYYIEALLWKLLIDQDTHQVPVIGPTPTLPPDASVEQPPSGSEVTSAATSAVENLTITENQIRKACIVASRLPSCTESWLRLTHPQLTDCTRTTGEKY